tara:strand:+ start:1270 stop:2346 length:1077 start_codon:yes stop_codon:yes gene_type:complete
MSNFLEFRYAGTHTNSNRDTSRFPAYLQGWANGNTTGTTNGGEAAMGSIVPMADLSASTSPTPSGDYCYGWMWNRSPNMNNPTSGTYTAVNIVNTASAGDLYPVTQTPAQGTLVAYSLRAFLLLNNRLVNRNAPSGSVGSAIGVVAKFPGPNTGQDQDWVESTTGSLSCSYLDGNSDHDPIYHHEGNVGFPPRIAGYSLALSTLRYDGEQGPGHDGEVGSPAGNVRLVFAVPRYKDIDHTDTDGFYKVRVQSGTYAYNTWYHVRMDVIPNSGFDTVKIYSAPINAALGSESWTLLDTITISDTSEYYIDWSSSGHEYESNNVGFFTHYAQEGTGSARLQRPPSCLIDKFEFFTKDISG